MKHFSVNEKRKDKAVKRYYHFVMKQIKVAAAVIEKDGKILIAKRAYGTQKGRWERAKVQRKRSSGRSRKNSA